MKFVKYLPRFQKAYQSLETLAQREHWSRDEIEAFQLDRLNQVWAHAIAHVPYYARLQAAHQLPTRFEGLEEFQTRVPVLDKNLVRAQPQDFLSSRPASGSWKRTGGSTGTPMKCYWAKEAHLEMLRTKYRFYQAWGLDIFDRTMYLWGHSASFAPGLSGKVARYRQPLEDALRNRLRLSAYRLGHHDLRKYLEQIARFRPVIGYGYGSALYLLALEAEATGILCDSFKLFTLTGEPALPHQVSRIERVFGAPAVIEYGSIECGAIAAETPDRLLRVREDVCLLETLPRDDGRHDILVTVLNNPSFPLLRYAIGDVTDAAVQRKERGFATLENVSGRNNDFVVARSGTLLHSSRFDAFFKYDCQNIRRFRVRQRTDGALAVSIELDDVRKPFPASDVEARLRELVEGYPAKIDIVERIPVTAAGKHRLVVSDLLPGGMSQSGPGSNEPGASESGATESGENVPRRPAVVMPVVAASAPPASPALPTSRRKAARFRALLNQPELSFIMEAHNGLSAKIVQEAGFEAIWASGLSMSAALGVRDSNEASWTQVLETLEFMSDNTKIPILVDGDTGYGNFNNMRRLVRKLEQREIGGVCIEDKIFPKTNSFIRGTAQPLADIDEFCGRIKAGKDAQVTDEFVIVARCEAFIAGWGLEEAMKRCEAYRQAGADAVLIHSARRTADEVLAFKEAWGDRLPVVIVPTKYYGTPTQVFRDYKFAAVIWANHLMRSAVTAMQRTAQQIFEEESLINVEDRVAPLSEVFRLQGEPELAEAEKRYLPKNARHTRAIVLAAARGESLGELTRERPACMVPIGGQPLLARLTKTLRAAGVRDITVVRGYHKDRVTVEGLRYLDDERPEAANDLAALASALTAVEGHCLITTGDLLCKRYVPQELLDVDADFAITVDVLGITHHASGRAGAYVSCSQAHARHTAFRTVTLDDIGNHLASEHVHGEWMGMLKVSEKGGALLQQLVPELLNSAGPQATLDKLLQELVLRGHTVQVLYTAGNWLRVNAAEDVLLGSSFQ